MTVGLYAGTYDKNGGPGLVALTFDIEAGWRQGASFASARNASFGAYSRKFDVHYLVEEQGAGALGIYRHGGGRWEQLARIPTLGAEPCYVSLSADEDRLAIANYASGGVTLVALENGLPGARRAVRHNFGRGPVAERQGGPHAHCALFGPSGQYLYHVDLGTDEVLAYRLTAKPLALTAPTVAYKGPAGSGPRHLAFHPDGHSALLVSELSATLTLLETGEPHLEPQQTVGTAPSGFAGENLGGHLAINGAGNRAYVTNRGHDSIAVFAIEHGELALLQHVPSGGVSPRFFLLLEEERLLFLANEQSGTVAAFRIEVDGTLTPLPGVCTLPGVAYLLHTQTS